MELNRCVACGHKAEIRGQSFGRQVIVCSNDACINRMDGGDIKRMRKEWNYLNPWRPVVGDEVWIMYSGSNRRTVPKQVTVRLLTAHFPETVQDINITQIFQEMEECQKGIEKMYNTKEADDEAQ